MASHTSPALCSTCSGVDFSALFREPVRVYSLGALDRIVESGNCPFCQLVVEAVRQSWGMPLPEIRSLAQQRPVNFWVKTTFWAQDVRPSSLPTRPRITRRFRPSLGTDCTPHSMPERQSRITLCDLDVVIGGIIPFATNLEQDARQMLGRRSIPEQLDIDLAKKWIDECRTQHHHGLPDVNVGPESSPGESGSKSWKERGIPNFRLIDVKKLCVVEADGQFDYVTLSYVWGDTARARQDSAPETWWQDMFLPSTVEKGLGQMPWFLNEEKIPRTIRDVLDLAGRLGCSHLWIDLFCIRQDSSEDRDTLVKLMDKIYENASFTIVVASGPNADTEIPGVKPGSRSREFVSTIETSPGTMQLTLARPLLPDLLSPTTWVTRGWTFQEDVLSPRCLYITATEMFYACDAHSRLSDDHRMSYGTRFNEWRESYALESGVGRTKYHHRSPYNEAWLRHPNEPLKHRAQFVYPAVEGHHGPDIDLRFYDYTTFVEEYTRRELSHDKDYLAAFFGILRKFDPVRAVSDRVGAHGLLEDRFQQSLLWSAASLENRLTRRHDKNTSTGLGFPSWSWSGWKGPVTYSFERRLPPPGFDHSFWPVKFGSKSELIWMRKIFHFRDTRTNQIVGTLEWNDDELPYRPTPAYAPRLPDNLASRTPCLSLWTLTQDVERICPTTAQFFARRQRAVDGGRVLSVHTKQSSSTGVRSSGGFRSITWRLRSLRSATARSSSSTARSGSPSPERPLGPITVVEDENCADRDDYQSPAPGAYKLVMVGEGERTDPYAFENASDVWPLSCAVLLVRKVEYGYERMGLTVADQFEFGRGGSFEWINLV